jgi:DNA modification methylase
MEIETQKGGAMTDISKYEYYRTENGVLYHGDCLEILPHLEPVDLVLTDPPYGIKRDKGFGGFGGFGTPIKRREHDDCWDSTRPNKEVFDLILSIGGLCLISGGNYFADILPQSTHWIVWDKKNTMPSFGDAELIWSNSGRKSVKIITYEYNGLIGKEKHRYHPTQKPVGLFVLLTDKYSEQTHTILDPFLGSGTTAVACERLGRKWIGIELEEKYCEIAAKRIEAENRQLKIPGC